MREKILDIRFDLFPSDVTNKARMEEIFREYRPHIGFYEAAYKHVSLMKENLYKAIRINVGGTPTVTDLSVRYRFKD